MAQASIHFDPVKPGSEIHNYRLKDFNYIRKDLSHLNESWESSTITEVRENITSRYFNSVGQKMQKKATPIREAVVNINEDHKLEDLQRLAKDLEDRFGIRTFQIHVHKDEGHKKSRKEWKRNLHAHLVCDWTDKDTGKSLKLNQKDMVEMQSLVAKSMGMERGNSSEKKRLNAIQFKIQKEWEKLEKIEIDIQELKNEGSKRVESIENQIIEAKKQLSFVLSDTNRVQKDIDQAKTDLQEAEKRHKLKSEELEKTQSQLSRIEAIRKDLDKLGGKYISKTFFGLTDGSKTAENIKALVLDNQSLKKDRDIWKESYHKQMIQGGGQKNQMDRLIERVDEFRKNYQNLALVVGGKGKFTITTSGEKEMNDFFQKEYKQSLEQYIERELKQNTPSNSKERGV